MRLVDADKIQWKSYPNDYGETNDDYVEKCDIDKMPTVDAAPVVHGRWVFGGDGCVICSKCNEEESNDNHRNFCPNCGAKMDGGADHGA